MDFIDELLDNERLSSLEKDLAAVSLNDVHFTDSEKQQAMQKLSQRMADHDRHSRWRRTAVAAALAATLVAAGATLWNFGHRQAESRQQMGHVVPRNLDMVLTTTDGHALNLSEGGQLRCSELGYLTIKWPGQTLVCTPSPQPEQKVSNGQLCELRVPEGKRTQIELADGSRVWVNSATTISFPIKFDGNERRIRVDGEVYLEVAHKADCPFRVEANGFTVEVLGTKFGVTAYPALQPPQVVLAEGRVEVVRGDTARYQLQPGQLLTLGQQPQIEEVEAYTYTSWKDGLLYLNGTTLGEILNWLAKQYAVDINCAPGSSRLKVYGKLILEDRVEEVLNNLTVIEPIRYTIRNNQIFVDEK